MTNTAKKIEELYKHEEYELRQSMLLDLRNGPYSFWYKHILNKSDDENYSTSAKRIGEAFHCKLLQPCLFNSKYIQEEKFDGRTKDGSVKKIEFQMKNANKTILSANEMSQALGLMDGLEYFPHAKKLIDACDNKEHKLFCEDRDVVFRSTLDAFSISNNIIVDIKTVAGTISLHDDRAVNNHIMNYGYHVQAYVYSMSYYQNFGKWPRYFLIFFSKGEAKEIKIFNMSVNDSSMFKLGEIEYNKLMDEYEECVNKYGKSASVPWVEDVENEVKVLDAPAWAFEKLNEEI